MKTPYNPRISVASRVALAKHHQRGGTLPGLQYGSGFFGNILSGLKSIAVPTIKAIGNAALPMAKEALTAGLSSDGSMKQKLNAAAQSAAKKENLMALAKAGASDAMSRPF